jgi:hypothetical protein
MSHRRRFQLAKAEQASDEAVVRAERAERELAQSREGPDPVEPLRMELQGALTRIDKLSKSLVDANMLATQSSERASVLEEEILVRRDFLLFALHVHNMPPFRVVFRLAAVFPMWLDSLWRNKTPTRTRSCCRFKARRMICSFSSHSSWRQTLTRERTCTHFPVHLLVSVKFIELSASSNGCCAETQAIANARD